MSRVHRAVGTQQRLTEHDLTVLDSLATFRLLAGTQLRRLHHPAAASPTRTTAARKARAHFQRLVNAGVIYRLPRRIGGVEAGADGFIYGLTGLGQAVLDLDTGKGVQRRPRAAPLTKPAFADHLLACAELYVALVEYSRESPQVDVLAYHAEPACWRWQTGAGGEATALKPDGWLRLGIGEFERTVFLEHDLASESLPTIARKLRRYVTYWQSGQEQHQYGIFPQVWWIVPHAKRRNTIAATIRRLPSETRELFSVCLAEEAVTLLTQLPPEGGDT